MMQSPSSICALRVSADFGVAPVTASSSRDRGADGVAGDAFEPEGALAVAGDADSLSDALPSLDAPYQTGRDSGLPSLGPKIQLL